jgi:DNA invertase Pin-like site-specific DNA recombinase
VVSENPSAARKAAAVMGAKEVSSWAKKAREATARRDQEIREMHAGGATLRAIGEAAGLSHTAIKKILDREGTVER